MQHSCGMVYPAFPPVKLPTRDSSDTWKCCRFAIQRWHVPRFYWPTENAEPESSTFISDPASCTNAYPFNANPRSCQTAPTLALNNPIFTTIPLPNGWYLHGFHFFFLARKLLVVPWDCVPMKTGKQQMGLNFTCSWELSIVFVINTVKQIPCTQACSVRAT